MTRTKVVLLLGLLSMAGVALWLWSRDRDPVSRHEVAAAPPAAKPIELATTSAPPAAKPRVRRMPDPALRAALLAQIRAAQQRRSTAASASTATPAPELPADPTVAKEYIRAAVRELVPLLAECYEAGLERDPTLAGTLVVEFTIEGEPDVGGVIGASTVDPAKSTIADPQVRECIQETMFALEIDPPAGGGVTRVTYPFEFRPAE